MGQQECDNGCGEDGKKTITCNTQSDGCKGGVNRDRE